jgi:hypothetical protein
MLMEDRQLQRVLHRKHCGRNPVCMDRLVAWLACVTMLCIVSHARGIGVLTE